MNKKLSFIRMYVAASCMVASCIFCSLFFAVFLTGCCADHDVSANDRYENADYCDKLNCTCHNKGVKKSLSNADGIDDVRFDISSDAVCAGCSSVVKVCTFMTEPDIMKISA